MNFNLHFGELHSDNYINDKEYLFENYIPKCYNVKRILISFNCFSEYICKYEHGINSMVSKYNPFQKLVFSWFPGSLNSITE